MYPLGSLGFIKFPILHQSPFPFIQFFYSCFNCFFYPDSVAIFVCNMASESSNGTGLRGNQQRSPFFCRCGERAIICTVTKEDNRGSQFWGCYNYRYGAGCGFFKWVEVNVNDEREMALVRQRRRIINLQISLKNKGKWNNILFALLILSLGLNVLLVLMLLLGRRHSGQLRMY